ncbi:type IVB secretion system protein IcmH/DotU [Pseudomonas syringae]|uniref:type IVB secretion system protein IcmH/DotU n=1 Tax=Pseudomonas syringae TaxID=317 RepID=UPI0014151D03|nr:type IVB secretion system protein IcmH/DotU [Pseudomonas syringae]
MGDKKLNRATDMQNIRGENSVVYGRNTSRPESEGFLGIDDTNLFEGLPERLLYSAAQTPEKPLIVHVNPLVAAASELLAHVSRLAAMDGVGDIHLLNVKLSEQVKRFEAEARRHSIENEHLLAARYVLCTVVDEAVLNTTWGSTSDWSKISLLSRFHKETFGGEKFFQLLEKLSANPIRHLPVLELMYLCLALGFEGKYRSNRRGGNELEDIRDALYRQVRHLRGDVSRTLSPHWQGAGSSSVDQLRIAPVWLIALFTLISLSVLYSGFAWVLGEQREAVLKPLQSADLAVFERRS